MQTVQPNETGNYITVLSSASVSMATDLVMYHAATLITNSEMAIATMNAVPGSFAFLYSKQAIDILLIQ